ncbi:hypothetical protein CN637_06805 [Bacillus toyonensis]|nr:hypothetical protein CN637_06805 [Bacillus toyonensis]PFY84264.1 hypothetical protein COL59_16795 [Bacillus toyonensis]PHE44157.1 hypothetical protein COF71_25085 [Bacillus toyonensis]
MIIKSIKQFFTRNKLIGTLLGLIGNSSWNIYNVLCPLFNSGTSLSIPSLWPLIKFQSFGILVLLFLLILLITLPFLKSNYKGFADLFKKKYNQWLN